MKNLLIQCNNEKYYVDKINLYGAYNYTFVNEILKKYYNTLEDSSFKKIHAIVELNFELRQFCYKYLSTFTINLKEWFAKNHKLIKFNKNKLLIIKRKNLQWRSNHKSINKQVLLKDYLCLSEFTLKDMLEALRKVNCCNKYNIDYIKKIINLRKRLLSQNLILFKGLDNIVDIIKNIKDLKSESDCLYHYLGSSIQKLFRKELGSILVKCEKNTNFKIQHFI